MARLARIVIVGAVPGKLCCCPWHAGQLAKAIHVLRSREIAG
jgi:hypothetical protein